MRDLNLYIATMSHLDDLEIKIEKPFHSGYKMAIAVLLTINGLLMVLLIYSTFTRTIGYSYILGSFEFLSQRIFEWVLWPGSIVLLISQLMRKQFYRILNLSILGLNLLFTFSRFIGVEWLFNLFFDLDVWLGVSFTSTVIR